MTIGILAIQGDVIEHRKVLESLGVKVRDVRLAHEVDGISGIILPGGESTAQSLLLKRFGLFAVLKKKIEEGFPVWGTCAGAILLAKKVEGINPPETLGVMDIAAERNAYGSQLESFTTDIAVSLSHFRRGGFETIPTVNVSVPAVFIRAPKLSPLDDRVEVLARHGEQPVMMRQGNMLATSFHPELAHNLAVHQYFVGVCSS